MKRKTTTKSKSPPPTSGKQLRLPFIEHLLELRRRLFYVAVSVLVWSTAAYFIEHAIVSWLLAPAHGEKFIYTSVGGGLDFLFRVCLYVGLVMSIPVIIYQTLRYVEPLIGNRSTRFILVGSTVSGVLAVTGIVFGYFFGLPAALNFLLNQFHTSDITALITIQSYLHFVVIYLVGSSLIFQVPLVIFFINRLKPLKLKSLLKYEKWVVLISVIAAAAINPSPRVYDLAIIAVPMIMSYQIGLVLVWYVNRKRFRPASVQKMLEHDDQIRREREERLKTVEYVWLQADRAATLAPLPVPSQPAVTKARPHHTHGLVHKPVPGFKHSTATHKSTPVFRAASNPKPAPELAVIQPHPNRPQKYVNDFIDFRRVQRH